MKCSLCTDPETEKNRVLKCEKCHISVHMMCYGIEQFSKTWKCSPCRSGRDGIVCALCRQVGGAMKKTVCQKWVHVICTLFTDGTRFVDKKKMEPIDISRVSNSKRNKICVFCEKTTGFCCRCFKTGCQNRLHITCAQNNVCLKEEIQKGDKINFRAYCATHKPQNSSRRVSSVFVRDQVLKEKIQKKQQDQSNQLNAEWITITSVSNKNASEKRSLELDVAMNQNEQPVNKKLRKDDSDQVTVIDFDVAAHSKPLRINVDKKRLPIANSVPENRHEIAINLTQNDETPINPIEDNVGAHSNSVRDSIEKEKLPIDTSVAEKGDVVALDLTKSHKVPIIQTEANVGANSTPVRISIDKQRLKKADHILKEVESINMWWDTRDLRMANRHIEDELEDNSVNKENDDHA